MQQCITGGGMCCDRPISDYEIQDVQMRMQQRRANEFHAAGLKSRNRNVFDERVTNESRLDTQASQTYPASLMLQKNSFMVCQRSCEIKDCRFISFSQKRFVGFRDLYEFEKKRVLVASENQIKVLAYQPID